MAADPVEELIGASAAMGALRTKVRRLLGRQADARRLPPVLLHGETGTGKGLLARVLHRAGPRRDGPFVEINCAAIPEPLLEAELFGFERGAFTDARHAKPGLFQTANRGTLFLDEIGLMPETIQAKLLKALEERSVRRLGSTRPEPVDVWVVSATNEDLAAAVASRRFREDLYHRLAVLTLTLPPLRARGDDIVVLANHFVTRVCADYGLPAKTLAPDAAAALLAHSWPGNVRELGNVIERAALLGDDTTITAAGLDLPLAAAPSPVRDAPATLEAATRDHLARVLEETGWNISRAAARLGVTRNTVRARIERYGLTPGGGPAPRRGRRAVPAKRSAPRPVSASAPVRWESRRVALLRARLGEPTDSVVPGALERVLQKIEAFGGRIDGLGPRDVVAVFGLEPLEDAVTVAAHAAYAIRRALTADDVDGRVRLAVHATSGLVTAGPRRVELDVAVRQEGSRALDALIALCPAGEILVSRPAARFLERRFDMSPVAAGIDAQRLGHRASSPAVPARARPFVGRDHELALLRSRFDLAAEGHGQLVGIMGEAGLGKSRLVRELADGVAGDGIRHLEGHCLPFTGSVPYFPVVDIVRGACGLTEMDDATVAAERVGAALTEAGMPLAEAPSLLHMLGFKPDAPERELDTPELVRERTFEAVRQLLLRQSRRRPLLLVIEDVHWIDETSGALLASLAEMTSQSRILLVETYRPGYRPAAIDRSYATQITLSALSLSDSRRILDGILPGRPFARSVTDMVLAKAEGNPFFLEELARHVVDRGDGGGLDDIPDTVHAVLAARLDHLEPVARNVLLTAAVVGRSVPRSVLTAVAGLDESAIAAALRHLGTTEFLVENTFGPDATYAFKHALIHDVAYATLPPDRRRELHGRVLDAMEDLFGDRLSEHRARLAHHAFRGERWAAAARYLRDAGVEAAAASASREAIVLFEQALVALSHLPQDPATLALGVDVRVELRNALWTIAQLRRGLACLHEAEPLAAALGDRRRQARLSVHMATNCLVLGDNAGAGAAAHRTLALATELGHAGLTIDARQFLGFLYTSLGDYRRAAEYLEANLAALGGGGGRFEAYYAVHGRTWLVWALVELGRFDDADARAAEARTLAEASRQPHNLIASQWATGYIELGRGRPSEGVPALERAATLTAEWDIALWRRPCAALLGHAHALAGRLDVALPLLESVLGADENNVALALWTAYLADACLRAGQLGRARKIADDALALARAGAERGHEAHALAVLAAIDAAAHDARAPGRWGEALALAESLEMAPLAARCRAGFAAAATEGSRPC